jgi:hypothetical protein
VCLGVERVELKSRILFYINNFPIPASFWGLVVRACHGDKHRAGLVFYRAAMSKAVYPVKWISHGLKEGYAFKPCMAEEKGGAPAREWI